MKDGTTHLAYKAEHVVDLESDLVLAAEIYPANQADPATLGDSVVAAQLHLKAAGSTAVIEEAAADKGYHAAATIELCDFLDVRTYIPEPKRRHPLTLSDKSAADRRAVLDNRRRMKRVKEGVAAAAERGGRADVRAHLRDRRFPAELAPRVGQRDEAIRHGSGGTQPGSDSAPTVRRGQTQGLAGRRRPARACPSYVRMRRNRFRTLARRIGATNRNLAAFSRNQPDATCDLNAG